MHLAHIFASGMGGIRTSGDLVAWLQLIKKMKIAEAKKYVAEKLAVKISDLTNEEVMRQVREDLGIGIITSVAGSPKGMRAKLKVAELLDVRINSVELFKSDIAWMSHR
jgi:dimethylamine---corrinoid protein Co-methyltransferase